jgi:hypothetical protein
VVTKILSRRAVNLGVSANVKLVRVFDLLQIAADALARRDQRQIVELQGEAVAVLMRPGGPMAFQNFCLPSFGTA